MISSCQRRVHYDLSPAGGNLLDLRAKYFGLQINNVRDIMLSPSPKSYTVLLNQEDIVYYTSILTRV